MSKKYRVSAKQRLELVQEAFRILNEESVDNISAADYEEFTRKVANALSNDLVPRNAQQENE